MSALLDAMSPGEVHLPPSARTWARIIRLVEDVPVLELRDPNHASGVAEEAPRSQYLCTEHYLWRRVLPPAPLTQPETSFYDKTAACADPYYARLYRARFGA